MKKQRKNLKNKNKDLTERIKKMEIKIRNMNKIISCHKNDMTIIVDSIVDMEQTINEMISSYVKENENDIIWM